MAITKYIILTGGDTGANNLGDQWILEGVKNFYKKYLNKYKIVIMMDGSFTKPSDGFIYIPDTKEEFEKLLINVKDIQLLHYYGGGYLNEYWYNWKIWQCPYLLEKGLLPEKIIFSDLGVGPFDSPDKFNNLKTIAKKVRFFGLRDKNHLKDIPGSVFMFDRSVSLIDPHKVLKKSIIDILFNLFLGSRKRILINFRPGNQKDYVGIENDTYLNFFEKILLLKKKNISISFFPMMENEWVNESKNLVELIGPGRLKEIEKLNRPKDYIALLDMINKFDLVITTSYHAALGSIYSGVPVVGIYNSEYYENKFKGIAELIKQPVFKFVKINDFSVDDINVQLENGLNSEDRKYLFNTLCDLKNININQWKEIEKIL